LLQILVPHQGGSFGDFDNDGDLDLFVSNYFGNHNLLYSNNGDGTFTKITAGIIANDGGFSFGSSLADYDNDGFLDIYVVNGGFTETGANNSLYKNNGDGTFTKITTGAIVNDGGLSGQSAWQVFAHWVQKDPSYHHYHNPPRWRH